MTPLTTSASSYDQCFTSCAHTTPIEGLAFIATAAVTNLFIPSITPSLIAIGTALFSATLVLKALNRYTSFFAIKLTKEACKLRRAYPKLQVITLIFSLAISFLSKAAGVLAGIVLGTFGAIVLDVEYYKLQQRANNTSRIDTCLR